VHYFRNNFSPEQLKLKTVQNNRYFVVLYRAGTRTQSRTKIYSWLRRCNR